jgi:hypothetical protein
LNDLTEQFRLLVFEVLEHHLEMIEEAQHEQDIFYHVERCRWAAAYLKQHTIHTPVQQTVDFSGRYE